MNDPIAERLAEKIERYVFGKHATDEGQFAARILPLITAEYAEVVARMAELEECLRDVWPYIEADTATARKYKNCARKLLEGR